MCFESKDPTKMKTIRLTTAPALKIALAALLAWTLSLGLIPSQAEAATINFSSGTYFSSFPNGLSSQPFNSYVEGGFTFQTPQASGQHLDANNQVLYWHEGGANTVNNIITLTYASGAFNLLSFDLVEIPNNFPTFNPAMTITGSNGSQFFTGNEAVGTFNLGWTDLAWVTFDINGQGNIGGNAWMDNVTVQAVPAYEPGTFALLLASIGVLGGARRLRN